jgi:uncharacterized protein (TIGR02301 family)
MSLIAPLVLAAAIAGRDPEARQALVDLAYVLGEAHALRQVCSGPTDQTWRARMNRLIELEKPDDGLNRRLVDAFNGGFMTRQAEHKVCDEAAQAAERVTAERGRRLAARLAGDES